jgi:hypothetical protein
MASMAISEGNERARSAFANPDPLFDTAGAARYLCEDDPPSIVTMERWRRIGIGPAFVRMGGIVRYRRSALDAHIVACTPVPRRCKIKALA